ncbi:MAG: hypothetical protein AB2L07_13750 [Thermoanaerobaculaceae bacterium]
MVEACHLFGFGKATEGMVAHVGSILSSLLAEGSLTESNGFIVSGSSGKQ